MGAHRLGSPTGAGLQALPSPVLPPVSPLEGVCTNTCQVSSVTIHSLCQQIFASRGSAHLQTTQEGTEGRVAGSQQGKAAEESPVIVVLHHSKHGAHGGVCQGVRPALGTLEQLEIVCGAQLDEGSWWSLAEGCKRLVVLEMTCDSSKHSKPLLVDHLEHIQTCTEQHGDSFIYTTPVSLSEKRVTTSVDSTKPSLTATVLTPALVSLAPWCSWTARLKLASGSPWTHRDLFYPS